MTALDEDASEDTDETEEKKLRRWHIQCLRELGCSRRAVDMWADDVDVHDVARLIRKGCPPDLAVDISRT